MRDHHGFFSILIMFGIVLCTGYMAFCAKRDAEVRKEHKARINRANSERIKNMEDLAAKELESLNRVDTFQCGQVKITGTRSFRNVEIHKNHQIEHRKEWQKNELERAELDVEFDAEKDKIDNKVAEEHLKAGENAVKAVNKAVTANVNALASNAKRSIEATDNMHYETWRAAKKTIKSTKKQLKAIEKNCTENLELIKETQNKRDNVATESNEQCKSGKSDSFKVDFGVARDVYLSDYSSLTPEQLNITKII